MSTILEAEQRRDWMKSRRKMRKAARRARSRRQTMRFTMLAFLLVLGALGFTHLPWRVHNEQAEIVVHGNAVVSREQILQAMRGAVNVPVYRLDPRQLEQKLAALKAVRHAFVRRYALPHPRLLVEILEEHPWASYSPSPDQAPTAVIAQSGRFIPIAEFPTVTKPELVIYGQPSLKLTAHEVVQWASWVDYIHVQTGRPVTSIDMRQPFDVAVQDSDIKLKIGTPDTTLTRRLGRLASILPTVSAMTEKVNIDYVDLSLDNSVPLKIGKGLPHKNLHALAQSTGFSHAESSRTGSPHPDHSDSSHTDIAHGDAGSNDHSTVQTAGVPTRLF
ncbi:MAG: FtsQ-type POTRA domain-containing protein [Cyanobacteria bacterium REEB67]|nr:FtsQ-type POTRA domain-containing protein [Cyanobacteria bacterium REEB67]